MAPLGNRTNFGMVQKTKTNTTVIFCCCIAYKHNLRREGLEIDLHVIIFTSVRTGFTLKT